MRILYVQYSNPAAYPPIEHSASILADAGHEVRLVGTLTGSTDRIEMPARPRIEMIRMPFCGTGWKQKVHFGRFCLFAIYQAVRWQPDWVYASDVFACPAAWLIGLAGFRVIYHEHDSVIVRRSVFARILMFSRRGVARRAAIHVLPNQGRVASFQADTCPREKPVCVWNCPSRLDAMEFPVKRNSELVVAYHGSIDPMRVPRSLMEAVSLARRHIELRLVGHEPFGHRNYLDILKKDAERFGVADRVLFIPALPRAQVLEWAREAHVGIAFMPKTSTNTNIRFMVGASNKAFEYLACGAALLVCEAQEWVQTFVQPGYALACDPENPRSIADALDRFADDLACTIGMGMRGRQRILDEWNYEGQFEPVLQRMREETRPRKPQCD